MRVLLYEGYMKDVSYGYYGDRLGIVRGIGDDERMKILKGL